MNDEVNNTKESAADQFIKSMSPTAILKEVLADQKREKIFQVGSIIVDKFDENIANLNNQIIVNQTNKDKFLIEFEENPRQAVVNQGYGVNLTDSKSNIW